ncbi:MAG: ATP-binding protein [Marinifilaceae bacterium]|jgi:nitrogen fixation/metabolism regulation signal transduction histidine kinase|nr:ATP-binding protein [Marinifilaceae bacterium]
MTYNKFTLGIIIHIVFLALSPAIFFYLLRYDHLVLSRIIHVLIWLIQILLLFKYLNRVDRDFLNFAEAIKYNDSSIYFGTKNRSRNSKKLVEAYNYIIEKFSRLKIENEKNFIFYSKLIESISIGLIAIDKDGKVLLTNNSFEEILNINHKLNNINQIENINYDLFVNIKELRTLDSTLVKLISNNQLSPFLLKCDSIIYDHNLVKIYSLQNVKTQIEHNEMDAWQKLIRIFTHEITNSISPISLLSFSLYNSIDKSYESFATDGEQDLIGDISLGLQTISKRSRALLDFTENYKKLTNIPQPKFQELDSVEFISSILVLMNNDKDISDNKIKSKLQKFYFKADESLLSLVIINLLKNSFHALKNNDNGIIEIEMYREKSSNIILVSDNGIGIEKDEIDNIFTPFYSTKKNGTGIGLSLSRQILRMHTGNISVSSIPNKGACFKISF